GSDTCVVVTNRHEVHDALRLSPAWYRKPRDHPAFPCLRRQGDRDASHRRCPSRCAPSGFAQVPTSPGPTVASRSSASSMSASAPPPPTRTCLGRVQRAGGALAEEF